MPYRGRGTAMLAGASTLALACTGSAGAAPPTSVRANASLPCTAATWNPVQAIANGLVTGNCTAGWVLSATVLKYAKSNVDGPPPKQSPYYWGGLLANADYGACGYINNVRVGPSRGANLLRGRCTKPDMAKRDFVYCSAAPCGTARNENANLAIWTRGTDGGVQVNNRLPCPHWANYRPFSRADSRPRSPVLVPGTMRQKSTPAGRGVELRYVAKYPSVDGSGYYAMIHDRFDVTASWFFVPLSCITGKGS